MNKNQSDTPAARTNSFSWRNFNLGTKLTVAFLAVTLIPLALIAYVNDLNSRQALTVEANDKLSGAAQQTAALLDEFMIQNTNSVRTDAQFAAVVDYVSIPLSSQRENSPQEIRLQRFLASAARRDPVYLSSIAIIDTKGKTLVDTDSTQIGSDRSNRVYFQEVLKTNRPYASTLEYDTITKKPSLYFAAPIRDAAGKIIGVIRERFDGAVLMEYISAQKGLVGAGSFAVLVDENHMRIAHASNISWVYKLVVPIDAARLAELQAKRLLPPGTIEEISTDRAQFEEGLNNADTQPYFTADLTGDDELEQVAVARMKTQNWQVAFAVPQTEFLAPINAQAQNNILLTLGIGVVVGILGFVISRTLSGPIARLTETAQKIGAGDINLQAKVETGDEIGALAGTFNRMTHQLREFIATLEQRVAERTKALATTSEVSRRLSTILDQKELVSEVVEQVKNSFNYYHAHIYFFDADKENLVMAGGTGEAGKTMLAQGHKIVKGRGLVGRAAESKEPILVSNTTLDENWLPNPLLPETKAEVAVPISLGDEVLGVLDVQQNIVDGLKSDDIDSLQSIANQVAVAYQNIRQYENSQKVASDLAVVAQVGIATATLTNIDELLQEVVDLSKKSFNLYHAHIYMLNETGDTLQLAAGAGDVGRQMVSEGRSIPMDSEQSLVVRAARSQSGVVVNDVAADPNFLPNPLLPETHSEMAVPMLISGKTIGVLDVQSEIIGRFTDVDVSIKTTLASQIAVAVQNARNFAQSKRQAERETAVNAIAQKIQNATTVEAALQVAARELGHALGMKQTRVEVDPAAVSARTGGSNE